MSHRIVRWCACLFLGWAVFSAVAQVSPDRVDVLVIDPGHGGTDPGCVGKVAKEKDIVLAVALKFGNLVKEKYPDVKVVYTRSDDRFVELWKRGQIANDHHADLFVSIHCNAVASSSAKGMETWLRGAQKNDANLAEVQRENAVIYQEKNHEKNYSQSWMNVVTATVHQDAGFENSIYFAQDLQGLYKKGIPASPDRGLKQGPFYVLWKSARPSVLTEIGFLSNPAEEKFLRSEEGQNKVAQCLLDAFSKYKQRIDSRSLSASVAHETKGEPTASSPVRPEMPAKSETGSDAKKAAIEFRVQVAASGRDLDLRPYNFKGLSDLSKYYDASTQLYKYYYSGSPTFEGIQTAVREAKEAGYTSAFVAAFENGEPVPVQQAIDKQNSN